MDKPGQITQSQLKKLLLEFHYGPAVFFTAVIVILIAVSANAQVSIWQADHDTRIAMAETPHSIPDTNTAASALDADSLFPVEQPKLLPDNISFGEKFLWGKNGLLREMGIVPPLSVDERQSELHIRRAMLTAHQIGGFTTLALMWSAVYFGQKAIDGDRRAGDVHQTLVAATMFSYAATGLLAILSPPPLIRRDEEGTVAIHKTLAWVHLAGMIITPIIGSMIRSRHHHTDMTKAHYHQIAGYVTTAVFTAAVLTIVF